MIPFPPAPSDQKFTNKTNINYNIIAAIYKRRPQLYIGNAIIHVLDLLRKHHPKLLRVISVGEISVNRRVLLS